LYPFIKNQKSDKFYENLKISSIGVISAYLKFEEEDIISIFLKTEIIPIILNVMKNDKDIFKLLGSFVI
jgi:CCR4-NOT transcription complex subunit 9